MEAVVVTHNSAPDVRGLVRSPALLQQFTKVYCVDSASSDDTAAAARSAGFVTLPLHRNVGFAASANIGAAATQGPIFAVMNPDIRAREGTECHELARHFTDPSVGLVAPLLELPSGEVQDSARIVPSPVDLVNRRFGSAPRRGAISADFPTSVPWVVGAFFIVRREAFLGIGGFDAGFRLYFEDVDLCVRLRAAGWQIIYDPTVRLLHRHAADSRRSLHDRATRLHVRSAIRFYRKHPGFLKPRMRGSLSDLRGYVAPEKARR